MDNKYLVLVNKNHPLENDDIFEKVDSNSNYAKNRPLEKETLKAFQSLRDFVKEKGFIIDVESGYRSALYQQGVWDNCVKAHGLEHTKKFVAVPGYSEHQTGLAVDFVLFENGKWFEDQKMIGHEVLDIVAENAYKFGFIIRYPKGKEDITGYGYEPWHLRFINNPEVAKYIKDNNLCLEEYLELNKKEI